MTITALMKNTYKASYGEKLIFTAETLSHRNEISQASLSLRPSVCSKNRTLRRMIQTAKNIAVTTLPMEAFYTLRVKVFIRKGSLFIRLGGCDVGCSWCDVKKVGIYRHILTGQ
jgi:hypothetical protein